MKTNSSMLQVSKCGFIKPRKFVQHKDSQDKIIIIEYEKEKKFV